MAKLSLTFREQLPPIVADELDQLLTRLNASSSADANSVQEQLDELESQIGSVVATVDALQAGVELIVHKNAPLGYAGLGANATVGIAQGGTNSSANLNNERVVISRANAIVENVAPGGSNYVLRGDLSWTAPAALTKTDDTNVTLTLGGSPTVALLAATSLTLGWTGQLSIARGGTNASSQTTNGICYFDGTKITTGTKLSYDGSGNVTLDNTGSNGVKFRATGSASGGNPGALFQLTDTTSGVTWNIENGRVASALTFFASSFIQASIVNDGAVDYGGTIKTGTLNLGVATSFKGSLTLSGNTSGTVTIRPQAAAGTWNFTLPNTVGTSGYALTTDGVGTATSWTALSGIATGFTAGSVIFQGGAGTLAEDNAHFFYNSSNVTLGLGTQARLGGVTGTVLVMNGSTTTASRIQMGTASSSTTAGGTLGELGFWNAASNNGLIRANLDAAGNADSLLYRFYVRATGGALNNSFTLYSDSSVVAENGPVGIGITPAADRLLDVNGNIRGRAYFELYSSTASARSGLYVTHRAATGAGTNESPVLFAETGLNQYFFTDGQVDASHTAVFTTSGFFGIGTASPSKRLHISDATTRPDILLQGKADGVSTAYGNIITQSSAGVQRGVFASNMDSSSNTQLSIISDGRTGGGNAYINFFTAPNGGSLTERARIDHQGVITWGAAADYGVITYDTGLAIYAAQSGKALRLSADGASNNHIYINTAANVLLGTATDPFSNGNNLYANAILINNNTGYLAKDSGGTIKTILKLNNSDQVILSGDNNEIRMGAGSAAVTFPSLGLGEAHFSSSGVISSLAYAASADADTTPSVLGVKVLYVANTGATTITNFDDGYNGQIIVVIFADANTTVDRTHAYLSGGVNFVSSAEDTLTLVYRSASGNWHEVARGVNA